MRKTEALSGSVRIKGGKVKSPKWKKFSAGRGKGGWVARGNYETGGPCTGMT